MVHLKINDQLLNWSCTVHEICGEGFNATLLFGTPFFARLVNEHHADGEALFVNFKRWNVVQFMLSLL